MFSRGLSAQSAPTASTSVPATRDLALLTIRDVFWFVYLYPLRWLSACTPAGFLYLLAHIVPFYARKRTRAAVRGMLAAPGSGIRSCQATAIARKFLANSSVRMLDDLLLSWPNTSSRLGPHAIEGIEHLTPAMSRSRGVLLLSSHFCADHVAKRHLAHAGYPVLTVRDHVSEGDWWGRFGKRFLAPRRLALLNSIVGETVYLQDPGFTLKILGALRSGGLVDIHFDGQSGTRGTSSTFLGAPRRFSTGVLDIVRLSGCSVIPMLCLGCAAGFRIVFKPALNLVREAGREEFVRANLPAFIEAIEEQVRAYPEEWEQWMSI
jgi:lauroyl/myristoyl acyltransferase